MADDRMNVVRFDDEEEGMDRNAEGDEFFDAAQPPAFFAQARWRQRARDAHEARDTLAEIPEHEGTG